MRSIDGEPEMVNGYLFKRRGDRFNFEDKKQRKEKMTIL